MAVPIAAAMNARAEVNLNSRLGADDKWLPSGPNIQRELTSTWLHTADHVDQKKYIVKNPSLALLFDLSHPRKSVARFFSWVGFLSLDYDLVSNRWIHKLSGHPCSAATSCTLNTITV